MLSLCSSAGKSACGPLSDIPPYCGLPHQARIPMVTMSLSLLPFSVWSLFHLLCRSCLGNPQLFFKRKCFLCKCIFGVLVWEDEFRAFLHHHLRLAPKFYFLNVNNYQILWIMSLQIYELLMKNMKKYIGSYFFLEDIWNLNLITLSYAYFLYQDKYF